MRESFFQGAFSPPLALLLFRAALVTKFVRLGASDSEIPVGTTD